jgi:retron-type reverse transcriptase
MELLLGNTEGTMEPMNVYTKQQRIAELARLMPDVSFTSLAYHIDLEWMHDAYRKTRKDGAAGVDDVTAEEYERDLEENLLSLLERFKSGRYIAPPVKRKYIPKGEGRFRPIGIPTLEDKILQRAVVMVLTPLYEQDFLDCSYGFRPERSVHQALESLWKGVMGMGGCPAWAAILRRQ